MTDAEVNLFLAEKLMEFAVYHGPIAAGNIKNFPCAVIYKNKITIFNSRNDLQESMGITWDPCTKIEQALGDGGEGTVVGAMKAEGWDLRLHTPSCVDEERPAAMFCTHRPYCSYQKDPPEWGGPHPNPYVNSKHPKDSGWHYADIPARAISHAAAEALKGEGE